MKIDILTLFPEMFTGPFDHSIIKRACDKGLIEIAIHNLRDWAADKHRSVDDKPYGGGKGMILRVDVLDKAINNLKSQPADGGSNLKCILLTPQGKIFNQAKAKDLVEHNILLICGHYEGFDERVRLLVDEEISIGEYVLTGGELPAMVITDTIVRLIPGVLPEGVIEEESFSMSAASCASIEYPQYTFPREYKGMKVPEVLLSGNHAEIKKWRFEQTRKHTLAKK